MSGVNNVVLYKKIENKCTKIIHMLVEKNLASALNLTETTQKN